MALFSRSVLRLCIAKTERFLRKNLSVFAANKSISIGLHLSIAGRVGSSNPCRFTPVCAELYMRMNMAMVTVWFTRLAIRLDIDSRA